MLSLDLRGVEFNKAERNRQLQNLLNNRSRGSVEWKHQNISAIMVELGLPYVRGYKPRFNYQDLLGEVVEQRLAGAQDLFMEVERIVTQPAETLRVEDDILSILVPPPKREDTPLRVRDAASPRRSKVPRNFLKAEADNASLGLAGEEFILEFEHKRLWR